MLFIVGTPIGNFKDITYRAVEAIRNCDCIFSETTSQTLKLLNYLGIKKQIHHYNDHNQKTVKHLCRLLAEGKNVCLISDGGMPNISDPGFLAIKYAREKNIRIEICGGISALINAVSGCGFDVSSFVFLGFLQKSNSKIIKEISYAINIGPVVVYESPRRVLELLNIVANNIGNIEVVIAREMTKIYEQWVYGNIFDVINKIKDIEIKGEITLVFNKNKNLSKNIRSIGFVCSANTCRSVMAHYYSIKKAKEIGVDLEISSSGIMVYRDVFSKEVVDILKKEGINYNHIPTQIDRVFIDRNDLILTMTRQHRDILCGLFPEHENKIFTVLSYAGIGNGDIYDPFGKSFLDYELVFKQIKKAVDVILDKIKNKQLK